MKELLILGAGTGGSLMANKMVRVLPDGWRVTVVDQDDKHIYQPGLLFLPFGHYKPHEIVKPRMRLIDRAVRTIVDRVAGLEPERSTVVLAGGEELHYDLLVIATGAEIRPELTEGLLGKHWRSDVHEFYSLEGSTQLAARMERFDGGRLVVNFADMPIKCPVAPLEFAFLADAYLTQRGIRDKTELVFATPLDGAFTKPVAASLLGDLLDRRNIKVVPNFVLSEIDPDAKVARAYGEHELDFDLMVTVPLHGGTAAVRDSLGDELGFVPTDKHTLQSKAFPNIFVIGDATDLPTSKAGAVAHFQGDVLPDNLLRFIDERPLWPGFDGHANCFIETGHGKAMLLDFNYETEPLPGRFPLPGVGPFSLLEESSTNHWGKLAFRWMYWNVLVKGEELPMDHNMSLLGKRRP